VTHLGSSVVVLPLVLVVGGLWWLRRRTALPLVVLASSYAGAVLIETGLKHLVARARPPVVDQLVHATGYAFPSGHATVGTAVWVTLAVLAIEALADQQAQWMAAGVAVAIVVLVDLSRVYLGVHWASDVLAGSVIGGGWALAVVTAASSYVGPDGVVGAAARAGGRVPATDR
jgi:undecaprenyl-diphosphatase